MNYEDALKRVKGSTWLHASKSLSKTPFDTPADRWVAWSTILMQYDKVTAEQVVISWLRAFFPDDQLLDSKGAAMVYLALHKYTALVKEARRMGLQVKRLMNETPPRLDFVRARSERKMARKRIKKANKRPKLKVAVGEPDEPKQPANVAVMPAQALVVGIARFAILAVKKPREGISEYKLLKTCHESGVTLEQLVDLMEKVAS